MSYILGAFLDFLCKPRAWKPDFDNDSASMVLASYLSDYHVHRQRKLNRGLSEFQKKLMEFTDSITKLGTIRKLVNITNRFGLILLECAEGAVNEAGSAEFPFGMHYRALACADNNNIELVIDQYLLLLCWQPVPQDVPGSLFLHQISMQVSDQVFFSIFLLDF